MFKDMMSKKRQCMEDKVKAHLVSKSYLNLPQPVAPWIEEIGG